MLHGQFLPGSDADADHIFLCNFRVAAYDGHEPSKLIMKIEASFCTSYVDEIST